MTLAGYLKGHIHALEMTPQGLKTIMLYLTSE